MGKRRNVTVLAVLIGLVGALLATSAAFGDPNTPIIVDQGVLRLHLEDGDSTPDDDFFRYEPTVGDPQTQVIEQGAKCDQLTLTGPALVSLTAPPGKPGQVDDGLGVRITGPRGTRCGQFDEGEVLILALGEDLAGKKIDYAEIDFEIKFDAQVLVEFYDGLEKVGELPVFCNPDLSDCGPDSTDGDNYRARVEDPSGDLFDEIRLRVIPSGPNAAASLEGGADGTAFLEGGLGDALVGDVNDGFGTSDSLFHLVEEFDGDLNCLGEPAIEGDDFTSPKGTFWRQDNSDGSNCILKPYTLTTGQQEIDFQPVGQPNAVYLGKLEFLPEPDPAGPVGIQLEYDDGGGLKLMQWCKVDPRDPSDPTKLSLIEVSPDVFEPEFDPVNVLPGGETWCLIEADFVSAGYDTGGVPLVDPTYDAYGTGDPGFRLG